MREAYERAVGSTDTAEQSGLVVLRRENRRP
jgi:hypothetical protein